MEGLALLLIVFSFSALAFEPLIETGVIDDGSSVVLGLQGSLRSSAIPKTSQNLVEAHIIGGSAARQGDYPWIIKSVTGFGTCSATLIHSDMALTAAHCQGVFAGGVYVSAFNYDHIGDDSIFREVDRHYRNVDYNLDNTIVAHDIMLIRLAEPVENVAPVILNNNSEVPTNFEDLIAMGFGFTSRDGDIPSQLMEVGLNYIPFETCARALDLFDNVRPGPGLLCAGSRSGQESTCNGDSGGPLLTSDGLVQVGVTSFGVNCDTVSLPNGFTRVSHYYDWIQETICKFSNYRPSDCPEPEDPDPRAVSINVTLQHDSFPSETTWAIRDRSDNSIKVAGPIGNPTPFSRWYTTLTLLAGEYTFEIYDQRGDGMGSVFPERTGFFEITTDVNGETESLVPLTPGFFESVLKKDFEVPERLSASSPTLSPEPALSSSVSPYNYANGIPSINPSDLSSDIPSPAPSLFPLPASTLGPISFSSPPSIGQRKEGLNDVPSGSSNATSNAMHSSSTNPLRGKLIEKWLVPLLGLAIIL